MIKASIVFNPLTRAQTNKVSEALDSFRAKIAAGEKIEFNSKLWKPFKNPAWAKQGFKCCFCEKRVSSEGEGDIEHFRPKGEVRDIDNNVIPHTGYWWLSCDPRNFLFCCGTCNNLKGNKLPLANEADRVANEGTANFTSRGKYGNENPDLINPRFEDPEPFFTYDTSRARVPGTVYIQPTSDDAEKERRAKSTIKILDLNRRDRTNKKMYKDTLLKDRAEYFLKLQETLNTYRKLEDAARVATARWLQDPEKFQTAYTETLATCEEQRKAVKSFIRTSSPFAGMCRFYLRTEGYESLIED